MPNIPGSDTTSPSRTVTLSTDDPSLAERDGTSPGAQGSGAALRWFCYSLMIVTAAVQAFCAITDATVLYSPKRWPESRPPASPMFSANDRSRWCTVWSLAERGTWQIDEIIQQPGWDTIDKVRKDGHYYSSKPGLLPAVVAGVYWSMKRLGGPDLFTQTHAAVHLLLLLVNWLPHLALLILTAAVAERYGQNLAGRYFVVATACFGTFLTPFLTTLNNHTVGASAAMFSLYAGLRIAVDGRRGPAWFFAAGFFSVWVACNELPAAILVPALVVLLWRAAGPLQCAAFGIGGLIPGVAFLMATRISTGAWLPFYSAYGTELYRYSVEGVPSYWMQPTGIDRGAEPAWQYLLHCTVGHHGLFSLTPVWVLSACAWTQLRRWPAALQRWGWLSLGLTVWVFGFYLSRTDNYNYGGVTSGLRWTFWLIPFWLLSLLPAFDRWGHRGSWRILSLACLAVSLYSVTAPRLNPWQPPWLQTWMELAGWVDYSEPAAREGEQRPTWLWTLPQGPEPAGKVEFRGVGTAGLSAGFDLEDLGPVPGKAAARQLRLTLRAVESRRPVTFEAMLTDQGLSVEPLAAPPGAEAAALRITLRRFFQGLPTPAAFQENAASVRYLKTPLQPDALRCTVATAFSEMTGHNGERLACRRAVWLCPDVPFGVAQIEDTVFQRLDQAIVHKQRLVITRVSKPGQGL